MSAMHNPAHPGEVLKRLCLEPVNLSVTEAAERLGVSRKTISKIINGHGSITPEMAVRLELVFGSTAQTWMNMQTAYDLWRIAGLRKTLKKTLGHTAIPHPVF
ncbi:MAG: addiction module antidote protein, HigA family [Nitrospirae bacterium]|nr:MAG: addiction module antidote protein, HigA family [Nitrospirota bacterium]